MGARRRIDEKDKEGTSYWWLRTPGPNRMHAAYINTDGSIFGGGMVFHGDGAIRPAIWVSTEADSSGQTVVLTAEDAPQAVEDPAGRSTASSDQKPYSASVAFSDRQEAIPYDSFPSDGRGRYEDADALFDEFLDTWYMEGDDIRDNFEEFLESKDIDPDMAYDCEDLLEDYIEESDTEMELDETDILIDDDYDDIIDDYPNDYPDDDYSFQEDYEDFYEDYGGGY